MKERRKLRKARLAGKIFASAIALHQFAGLAPAFANGLRFPLNPSGMHQGKHHGGAFGGRPHQGQILNNLRLPKVNVERNTIQLDLGSSTRSIFIPTGFIKHGDSISVDIGGTQTKFNEGDSVTAAQFVAIQQAQSVGGQTLSVDELGRANGGSFSLNKVASVRGPIGVHDLVIPENVQAIDIVTAKSTVSLSGDLTNYGTISELARAGRAAANINALNITNQEGAVISSVGRNRGIVDLSLSASNQLVNLGTIESSGNLDIATNGTLKNTGVVSAQNNISLDTNQVTNTGTVQSTTANVNLNGTAQMTVTNTGGTISAANSININYGGVDVANVLGGDLFSQKLNIDSGNGTVDVKVNELTGAVSSTGKAVHVQASTQTLKIGPQCLVGDPTYYNDGGGILITGDIVVGENLAIIASGNITSTAGLTQIVARDGTGKGYDINIIAGANVTGTGGVSTTLPPGTSATSATFSGASTTGGDIDFSLATNLVIQTNSTAANTAGGHLILASYEGSSGGHITLPADSTISTLGKVASFGVCSGDIIMTAPNGISIGSIVNDTSIANFAVGNTITLVASQPILSNGAQISFDNLGAVTSGNRVVGDYANLRDGVVLIAGTVLGNGLSISTNGTAQFQNKVRTSSLLCVAAGKDISIGGDLTGNGLLLVAGHDIIDTSAVFLSGTGLPSGFGTTPVQLIAGSSFTQAKSEVVITGPSSSGGKIDLTFASTVFGFSVDMVAFEGSDKTGTISLPIGTIAAVAGGTILTPGPVSLISGATSGTGIQIGEIGAGYTKLTTSTPDMTSSVKISTSSFSVPTFNVGGLNAADIQVDKLQSGPALIDAGNDIRISTLGSSIVGSSSVLNSGHDVYLGLVGAGGLSVLSQRDVHLGGSIDVVDGLLIVAGRNIDSTVSGITINGIPNPFLTTTNHNITMIAGATWTRIGSDLITTGGSATGGKIDFQSAPIGGFKVDPTLTNGSINLAAYSGSDNTGSININTPGLTITTTAKLQAVSGSTSVVAIQVTDVQTQSGGFIDLETGTPGPVVIGVEIEAGRIISGILDPSTPGSSAIVAGKLISPGGRVDVRTAGNIQIGTIDVSDGATSPGGAVNIVMTGGNPLDIGASTINSITSISAAGGSTAGDAGSIFVSNANGINLLSAAAINITAPFGKGGVLELSASLGTISIPSSGLSVNGGSGNNDGGTITLLAENIDGNGVSPIILTAAGSGSGSGGRIDVAITGTTPVTIGLGADQFQLIATGGSNDGKGGDIIFSASNTTLVVDSNAIQLQGSGFDSDGGSLSLDAQQINNIDLSKALVLNASGVGVGDGGSISVSAQTLEIGNNAGQVMLIANSGALGGNGGSVLASSAGDLLVAPSGIDVGPKMVGAGGTIRLFAGTGKSGNLLITGSLSANGVGAKDGTIELRSNSTTAFEIGGKKGPNRIAGTISPGTTGGTIEVLNNGGGITQSVDLSSFDIAKFSTVNGSITLKKVLGEQQAASIELAVNGSGDIVSKRLVTAAKIDFNVQGSGFIAASNNGKKPLEIDSNTVSANSGGAINIQDIASAVSVHLNASESKNSSFTFKTAGNLIVDGTVKAVSAVTLASTAKDGDILLNEGVEATASNGIINILGKGIGTISNSAGVFEIKAFEVNLETKSGDIGTFALPLDVNTSNLSVLTTGRVTIGNSSKSLNLNQAKSPSEFLLRSAGDVSINTSLQSTIIDIATTANDGDIAINKNLGANHTTSIILGADGAGDIFVAKESLVLNAKDGSVQLSSLDGDIGSTSVPIKLFAVAAQANTNTGLVNLLSVDKGGITLANSAAGNSFTLLSNGSLAINNLTADSILLRASRGQFTIIGPATITANDGGIIFQNLGKTKDSSIVIAGDALITSNDVVSGGGEIDFVIGSLPPPQVPGTIPTNVTLTPGSTVFFNNGITVQSGSLLLTTVNTNINFSSGKFGPESIRILGNVTITADPPLPAPFSESSETLALSIKNHQIFPSAFSSSELDSDQINHSRKSSLATIFAAGSSTNIQERLFMASSNVFRIGDETVINNLRWISDTELDTGEIPATLVAECSGTIKSDDTGCTTAGATIFSTAGTTGRDTALMEPGSVLVASRQDKQIHTRFGTVSIAGNSLALVMSFKNGIGVFNLHDSKREAVVISSHDMKVSIAPGHCRFITNESVRSFDQINPAQLVAYRGIVERSHGRGLKSFNAQFSIPTLINALRPLRELMKSKHPHAVSLTNRFLKTTSILMQLQASGPAFQQVVKPAMAAYRTH